MRWSSAYLGSRVRSWLRDYDRLQSVAVSLIYIQIGCAMVGLLGALFNGVLLINLVVALFALVAIESSSQSLGRTYAVLLFISIVLDIAWFVFFSHTIWNFNPDQKFGPLLVFSIRLALLMEIFGFSVRFLSSFLWVQMYRLGVSTVDSTIYGADYARQASTADEILGGSIYDPAYYSSLFEDIQETQHMPEADGDSRKLQLPSFVVSPNVACNLASSSYRATTSLSYPQFWHDGYLHRMQPALASSFMRFYRFRCHFSLRTVRPLDPLINSRKHMFLRPDEVTEQKAQTLMSETHAKVLEIILENKKPPERRRCLDLRF